MPTLREIAEVFNGKTPSKAEQRNEGLPILKIRDIDENGNFVGIFGSYVDKVFYEKYSKKKLRAGDTLILNAAHSADYVGSKNALVDEELDGTIATGEWLIVRPKKANSSFINHFLKSPEGRQKIKKEVKGIHLYPKDVERITVPLPARDDQIRIATLLSRVETLIATRKNNLRLLDEFLKSTFLEMFGDPVWNEKGWETERLGNLAKVERGRFSPRPRNDPKFYNGDFPFIQTGDISRSNGRLHNYSQTLNEFGIKVSKEFKKDTIVIAIVGATIGETAVLQIDTYAPDSVIGITPTSEAIDSIYLEFLLRFWKPVLKARAPEAARANININTLKPLGIILPSAHLVTNFVSAVKKVEFLKTLYRQSLNELENLYGALSQKAFKGELDLSRIPLERVAEDAVSDTTTEPTDPIAKIDSFAMSDPAEREQLLLQLFDAFIAERKGASFSLDDFWTQAEQKVVDNMDEESQPLGVEDYDKAKAWLFDLLKSGQVDQRFNEENNRMELSIRK